MYRSSAVPARRGKLKSSYIVGWTASIILSIYRTDLFLPLFYCSHPRNNCVHLTGLADTHRAEPVSSWLDLCSQAQILIRSAAEAAVLSAWDEEELWFVRTKLLRLQSYGH